MLRKIFVGKRSATLLLLMFGALLGAAWAQTESVLYSFCTQANCTDGAYPQAGLIFDQEGNLYGTTLNGGASAGKDGYGVVFKLTPEGKYAALYTFCAQTNCTDGAEPEAGLVFDKKGNLYGSTLYGGAYGDGVVFKLTPKGKETVLYSFCAPRGSGCADGKWPGAGVILDQKGNLYGTTVEGGASSSCNGYGCGVVFKITPEGKETVLYTFCAQTNCTDGAAPYAGLIFDQKGNLYGTTYSGGGNGAGAVFKLTPKGRETVVYSFCAQGGSKCTDGAGPSAGLVFDQKGNLYGTTLGGEAPRSDGVVFELTPEGKETVLYSFCWQDNCTDGQNPYAGVVFDPKGNLYGTTASGGASDCFGYGCGGVVFKLTP
jgi:uncharacterized repeat protein (TIGR03803 family)